MSLRLRKIMASSVENDLESLCNNQGALYDDSHLSQKLFELQQTNSMLESTLSSLRAQVETLKIREKRIFSALQTNQEGLSTIEVILGDENKLNMISCPMEPHVSFLKSIYDRGSWLMGLMVFQSFSSFVLSNNEVLLRQHTSIVFFLTMLVGAGGNAGNQAAVRIIRGIAVGSVRQENQSQVFRREVFMAIALSLVLGVTGFTRALFSMKTSYREVFAITASLMAIVFISIVAGASLPLLLLHLGVDPAHSSTSIQVIMDILGVLITCSISSLLLN